MPGRKGAKRCASDDAPASIGEAEASSAAAKNPAKRAHHCDGEINPADMLTKPLSRQKLERFASYAMNTSFSKTVDAFVEYTGELKKSAPIKLKRVSYGRFDAATMQAEVSELTPFETSIKMGLNDSTTK